VTAPGQPIVAGWCYQPVVGLELQRDSWTAPVDVRRLDPADNHNLVAAGQIRALLARRPAGQRVPLVVFDGGFDPVQLQMELAAAPVQVLARIRSDRNFYAAGHPRRDGRPSRPSRHGAQAVAGRSGPPGRRPRSPGRRPTHSTGR
jgi:hypothetical protein